MISTLGSWKNNFIPGITSTPKLAENVYKENVDFLLQNKKFEEGEFDFAVLNACLLYTSPSPRDLSTSRMPSSA